MLFSEVDIFGVTWVGHEFVISALRIHLTGQEGLRGVHSIFGRWAWCPSAQSGLVVGGFDHTGRVPNAIIT